MMGDMTNRTTNLNRQLESLGLTQADLPSLDEARKLWAAIRPEFGFKATTPNLLAEGANVKIAKNEVRTWTLTLMPADYSGEVNACTWATKACRLACVMFTAGRQYDSVRAGRNVRTAFLHRHPAAFLAILTHEVALRERAGVPFGLRLNVASDIRFERVAPWLFEGEHVFGYDYSKAPVGSRVVPDNYKLTYSRSERWTDDDVREAVSAGYNVAMVFDTPKHQLPETYLGMRVVDGDISDFRYADPVGVIVGLAAKGAAKSMDSGAGQFVSIGKAA